MVIASTFEVKPHGNPVNQPALEKSKIPSKGEDTFTRICTSCNAAFGAEFVALCPHCGGLVDIVYAIDKVAFRSSDNPYERFFDLLPVNNADFLPGNTSYTPLHHAVTLGRELGLSRLYLKDESQHPTGTTKDHMAAVALAFLYESGVREFCTSSTGNSSSAYAHAISRFPDMKLYLFSASAFSERVRGINVDQVEHFVVEGATFVEAFKFAAVFAKRNGFVSERGFFNPGRREGLKLAFLEAAEQLSEPIDWYVQAVSSAMGVYGAYKGARELRQLGVLPRLPRLLCVQQETCAPMVRAWQDGSAVIRPQDVFDSPTGIAMAILRGDPTGAYPFIHEIVSDSDGTFTAVDASRIRAARRMVEDEGLTPCYSASAAVAGLIRLVREGAIKKNDNILVNLTGSDQAVCPDTSQIRRLVREEGRWLLEDPADERVCDLWETR